MAKLCRAMANLVGGRKSSEVLPNGGKLNEAVCRLSEIVGVESKRMNSLEAKVNDMNSNIQSILAYIEKANSSSSSGSGSAADSGNTKTGIELDQMRGLQRFTYENLKEFTDNFSDQNLIERTQFCKVYCGKIPDARNKEGEPVTVKIWADKLKMNKEEVDEEVVAYNVHRFSDELSFLENHRHCNLVKLKGSCFEDGKMGVVYELNSLDTLRNLITEGTLKWLDRIKILIQFAHLLEWLHDMEPRYLVRNISAAHIMIDQDFNPILFEFGMLVSCGTTGEMRTDCPPYYPDGAFGYIDPALATYGIWSYRSDVFAFGVLILELVSKRLADHLELIPQNRHYFLSTYAIDVWEAAKVKRGISLFDLVNKRFTRQPGFDGDDALKLMELAVKCVCGSDYFYQRPTMREIVKNLESLLVVRNHCNEILEE